MKILLVEDEQKIGSYLNQTLSDAGYMIDWVTDEITGKHLALLFSEYDLVILDVMFAGLNGWNILQDVGKSGKTMPLLFLIARDQIEERIKGFGLTFTFVELLNRIKSLLYREQRNDEINRICVADLELDLWKRCVRRAGKRINLTAQEYALIELFMSRRGEILPRALIASQLWDSYHDRDSKVIEVAISRLRNKIDRNFIPKLIHNVYGMGYVLEEWRGIRTPKEESVFEINQ
ncbi:winged helix-turn-helix domain-containing protein [Acinetobacter colistiniresistens]|uniref:Response regulator n=1 Tax=Acinetobacter colistiniresistens TaxID=280145 RepID=S3TQ17_9GAMM|nr:winged helix-turn-helix domain-containing protein [Acinetobacter colistiniresistens]EPG37785.1 two-component system, OmpR family, copper resistance phosphate regulon response regulator CusR [Acinetobacter colistiniresistens]TVT77856.1 response regulator [Acinetobacter colistiniresistens]